MLLAQGLPNGEISHQLVVSETTVKTHVARVLMNLVACRRLDLCYVR